MTDLIVTNIFRNFYIIIFLYYQMFSDKQQRATLNNIRVLLKGVLIDLRVRNFVISCM